jgi:ABC-type oligopeptide transport system substrate-binding subunit
VELVIEAVDAATGSQRFTSGDFELTYTGWFQDYPDPENWMLGLFATGDSINFWNCSNPDLDALLEAARYNANNDERRQQYRDAERVLIEDLCGIIPMYHFADNYLTKPELVGFTENSSGQDAVSAGDWRAEAWGLRAD